MSTTIQAGAEAWSADGTGRRADVTVVVTHGLTANPISTGPLGRAINAAGFGVDVLRLRGHGTSVSDFRSARYTHWRDEVLQAVDRAEERGQTVALVGHSMGGTLSLDVASSRPTLAGVAVMNPQILTPTQLLAKLAPVLQHVIPVVPRDLAGLPTDDIAKEGVEEGAYPMVAAKAAQSLIRELPRIRAQMADVKQPLLVIRAPQDHTVPVANAEAVPGLVGSDDVTELVAERCYHSPHLDHDAELVTAAIIDFVARVTGHEGE